MVGAILFHCVVFDTQLCLEIAKTNYLFLAVLYSHLNKLTDSCADWVVWNLVASTIFLGLQCCLSVFTACAGDTVVQVFR